MTTKLLTRVGQLAYLRKGDELDDDVPDYLESLAGDTTKIPGLKTFEDAATDYGWVAPFTTAIALQCSDLLDGSSPIWIAEWDVVEQRFNKVSELSGQVIPYDTVVRAYATMTEETIAAFIAEIYT